MLRSNNSYGVLFTFWWRFDTCRPKPKSSLFVFYCNNAYFYALLQYHPYGAYKHFNTFQNSSYKFMISGVQNSVVMQLIIVTSETCTMIHFSTSVIS